MDFTLSDEAVALRDLTRDIAEKICTDEHTEQLEAADAPVDDALWRELAVAGLLGVEIPETSDGLGLGMVESVTVAEQLGRRLARVPFGAHAVAAAPVIAAHGSPALRSSVPAAAASGTLLLTVALEEDLGTDPLIPQARLVHTDHGVRLSGAKVNVGYADVAGAFLVNAVDDAGVHVVFVPAGTPGVTVVPTLTTGRTPVSIVEFDDVAVGADDILAGGAATVAELADRMTLAVCADQSGTVTRALELTAAYAAEREQFGRAIGSFQAVAQRLADGYIDAQGLSLTTTQAAWRFALGDGEDGGAPDLRVAVQTAKFWACEAGHRVAHTAVHVHGGVGLDTTHPVHRYFLRAKQNEFTLGSAPVTLAHIGSALAATPA
ncbi:acyl-CoA/acyl-ACP dehydrogenase [Gordonia desulfuricans]|uniref:Acyl-CoA/acyl-ACP dehydrogenase n=1 Tax=Gordonia desulfuricans TaxID=89051 RepID=A0A7K3LJ06_9ACTN|nr:acyl-CoA dehydrogenase family protein [Gordonia desulfuricans]NDK88242.1 acyl-CoA/acyl-ACP dehydrogenase [Gordonia desulfuricans]